MIEPLDIFPGFAVAAVPGGVQKIVLSLQTIILRLQEDGDDLIDLIFGPAIRNDQRMTLADPMRELEGLQSVSFAPASPTPSSPSPTH